MINEEKIISLRMKRQHLICKADKEEYTNLYRDLQPGQSIYWNGFGEPPTLTGRADFNDIEYNRKRQAERILVKGRFVDGNIGWIAKEDFELFICVFRKSNQNIKDKELKLLNLIEKEGPMNIQQMKQFTGMLVKEITPTLHRLQQMFLIYEDQAFGEWDRKWHIFSEIFPDIDLKKYVKLEALKILIQRFAYRQVYFNLEMLKSFYRLPKKELELGLNLLFEEGVIKKYDDGWILKKDIEIIQCTESKIIRSVYALHRNDFLVKSNEYWLKEKYKSFPYNVIQYLLIDGKFQGALMGRFRNGTNDLEDVILDFSKEEAQDRKKQVLDAIKIANYGCMPKHYMKEGV